jgi:asparagine synthase (glutamine-hydrolysing)
MCGILGGLSKSHFTDDVIHFALSKMKHRGPDDRGYERFNIEQSGELILAHTRLSIIDLSMAGHQPMSSQDGLYTIVFNGEIYNYKELRQELITLGHSFLTESDTEVLLAAWICWGKACLVRLVGMFAFVVYDKVTKSITCVRDAFGIKPFFYSIGNEGFRFASELPALLAISPGMPSLNFQRAYDYLVHGDYDSSTDTFYQGIYHLPPAHFLSVDLRTGNIGAPKQWWAPSVIERPGWKFDDAVDQVRELFLSNIRLHLRSDVLVGAALSGGIDSSAVVCAMRYVEPDIPIHTFSYIAEGSDVNEEYWVDRVNEHVGAISHKVSVTAAELAHDLDDMVRTQGEPFGSTSIYAQYRVYKLAHEAGVTVTLDGQGADEMLAGYVGYPGQRLRSLLETGQIGAAWQFWKNWSNWPGRSRMLGAKYLVSELTGGCFYSFLRKLDGKGNLPDWISAGPLRERGVMLDKPRLRPSPGHKGRRVMDELALSLTQRGLPALLRHGDRNSMRFSVESRVPFLTLDMVNLLLSMPESFLISQNGETKNVFRAAMRGIVPDDVLNRKDKIGFETPERNIILRLIKSNNFNFTRRVDINILNSEIIKKRLLEENTNKINLSYGWRCINWANFLHLTH